MDAPYRPLSRKKGFAKQSTLLEGVPPVTDINPIRFHAIHEQLWLLGYLDKKESRLQQTSRKFKAAVRQFQEEAGLIRDGWTGNQTWQALNELVGFETRTDVANWQLPDGSFAPAFYRAAKLRLWAYGLTNDKPVAEYAPIAPITINRLKKILWCLRLIDDYSATIDQLALFKLLFDAELLVQATADSARPRSASDPTLVFRDYRLEQEENRDIKPLKRRFITNLAKTELWLMGSSIKIDGHDDYPVAGLPENKIQEAGHGSRKKWTVLRDDKVALHLREYWKDYLDEADDSSQQRARTITPDFFISLIHPEQFSKQAVTKFEEPDYSQEVANYFEQNNTQSLIDEAYEVIKGLGLRLWDGLKRLWRWVKNGVRKIITFARNIQRTFFRFALKGYKIIRTAFTALARSMEQYLAGRVDLGEISTVGVTFSKDMDFRSWIADTSSPADRRSATDSIGRFSAMFQFSFRLIACFVQALKSLVTGVIGWYHLVLVLVKSYRELVPAYQKMMTVIE